MVNVGHEWRLAAVPTSPSWIFWSHGRPSGTETVGSSVSFCGPHGSQPGTCRLNTHSTDIVSACANDCIRHNQSKPHRTVITRDGRARGPGHPQRVS